jgi:hypothetical protein
MQLDLIKQLDWQSRFQEWRSNRHEKGGSPIIASGSINPNRQMSPSNRSGES